MKRLLLFDVDGTLVDVDGAGRRALGAALEEVYGETGPVESFDFRGKTDPAIVRGLMRAAGRSDAAIDGRMEGVWERYLRALDRALETARVTTQPGVTDLLETVDADDRFTVGLVTGNVRGGAARKLGSCGLDGRFRFGAFGSDSERREDLPPLAVRRAFELESRSFEPREVWIIGDTPEDVRVGRRWELRTLAVATGGHDVGELRRHGAEASLPALGDTGAVVELLLS